MPSLQNLSPKFLHLSSLNFSQFKNLGFFCVKMMCELTDLTIMDNDDVGEETTTPVSLNSLAQATAASGSLNLTSSTPPAMSSVCMELWHVCIEPLILLPKKGSVFVCQPQGG